MTLLFITHKIHEQDDDFAFTSLWIKEFIRQGFKVETICLEKGLHTGDFKVHSLGKERGFPIWKSILLFWNLIFSLKYDRVFVHMNPKWVTMGAPYWLFKRVPVYLWYTHYTTHAHLRISHFLCKRLFAATRDSMPQYEGDPKKIITGHGIDLRFWDMEVLPREARNPKCELLLVHRICRSKRPHLAIEALKYLPQDYTLTIYGRVLEESYYKELRELVSSLGLEARVKFMGSVPMPELRAIYPKYQIMINMAMETIDKTMIEGMMAGLDVVTTPNNARAIGLLDAPKKETPEEIAKYILEHKLLEIAELRRIAKERHSLQVLVFKIGEYVKKGE